MKIEPQNDFHFRLGIMKEAIAKDVDILSGAFLVYQELRWYETDGKFGFCVAGFEKLGEPYGFTGSQVRNYLDYLNRKGLVAHIWCDKKVYRNKTKVWMSVVRLSGVGTAVEAMKVLDRGGKGKVELSCSPLVLKQLEVLETADGSVDSADGSVDSADGSVDSADGSVARIEKKQGSELYNELYIELDNELYKERNNKERKKKSVVDNKSSKKFQRPSVEEVQAYCEERKNQVNAESFVDYYESKGWLIGKSPMKDWKAAVRTWERNGYGQQNTNSQVSRGDSLYRLQDNEDITYKKMFEKWKKYLGVGLKETESQVMACRELLDDVGEDGLEKLIVALRMRSEHSFLTRELSSVKDFVTLNENKMVVQGFYDKNWKMWKMKQEAAARGKKVWEL